MTTKYYFIKSNHGNHTGFNRSWTLLSESNSRKELEREMLYKGFDLSDDIVERNGRPYDMNTKQYIVTNKMIKNGVFDYDGCMYMIISKKDTHIFNGGHFGHLPSFMENEE
ncbi:MAG: hypothetical protein LUE98_04615 [Tannerellaceae bacterium]|nr:hypothetical protein [Tannerellaceae bacterium]